jgi:hypothetical protein
MNIMKKNTEALIAASKEVGLEINTKKTKYMLMSHHRNAGHNRKVKIANRSFENLAKFKCLGRTITDQSFIHVDIKSRLN